MTSFIRVLKANKDIAVFLVLMVLFRSSFADVNHVPTGSMQPTIVEGDRLVINKLAYDIQLPLLATKLFKLADPKRGDIVVFNSAVSKQRLVKRVIGIPGDVVSMHNNQVFINGSALDYSHSAKDANHEPLTAGKEFIDIGEDLLGTQHTIRLHKRGSVLDTFAAVEIPSGFYLALGDNRDNSADSRVIGLVPRSEIIGRSRQVLMSLNPDNYYAPRPTRFFKAL